MYLGIDLGGSGTRAALVDGDGQLLATGRADRRGTWAAPPADACLCARWM